jgi:hypothetical protein
MREKVSCKGTKSNCVQYAGTVNRINGSVGRKARYARWLSDNTHQNSVRGRKERACERRSGRP